MNPTNIGLYFVVTISKYMGVHKVMFDTPYPKSTILSMFIWLVVWNMNFIFPYIGE